MTVSTETNSDPNIETGTSTKAEPSTVTPGATADPGVVTVSAVFAAIARRDFATVAGLFHDDATWNHHNDDRFGGIHRGTAEITGFMGESMQLTAGTLQPVPQTIMSDARGHVAALMHLQGTRPDGRNTDDLQVLVFRVEGGRVRNVEHFIGDPAAVRAFWA